ncbi:MAG: TIGR03790 family protein [Gammaproteobacteria bacterium]|nr:TIGR03790 family protein [Gammaproteobacteria bacterium]MDH5650570.1 TIGR03790 family protein [Gammaproteobacteria bacterium]
MKFRGHVVAGLILLMLGNSIAFASNNDVLVIVNDNSIDSVQVGEHYRKHRKLDEEQVIHVKVPNQYFINWTEFQSLRDQILRFGICPSVDAERRPAACNDASLPIYTEQNIQALTAATRVRYIVTTRGVPTRMKVDNSTLSSPNETTSVDNYLRFWLARYIEKDTSFHSFKERAIAFGDGRGMRKVNPAVDLEYIIGRIDGLDLTSAKALIDRAIEVEKNGWYGKLYGSTFGAIAGRSVFMNYETNKPIYGDFNNGWRYALGLFGENRPECSNYTSPNHYFAYPQNHPQGKAPAHCLAQFNKGNPNENMQGHSSSRSPIVGDALAYIGSLDGQTVIGGFNTLLNWRKDASCTVTLCKDAADPAACRAASTDPYREINTECVGVAPGFIGYNFQSYPVAIMAGWPTSWAPRSTDQNNPPLILDNDAAEGASSVWFSNADEVDQPTCYVYNNGNFDGTQQSCRAGNRVGLQQTINQQSTDPLNPSTYTLAYQLKSRGIEKPSFVIAYLLFNYPKEKNIPCPTGLSGSQAGTVCTYSAAKGVNLKPGDSDWQPIQHSFTTPANTGLNFTSIIVGFSGILGDGGAGIDAVSVKLDGDATELALNGSFEQGHMQTGTGDYAANFLSRLGGTAFWGSLSHHQSGGHSFSQTSLTTMTYLMRGLPLGDAVWLGEGHVSGILYGDPLYSPLAVRLQLKKAYQWNFITGDEVKLKGSTVNGTSEKRVATTYSIDYCRGDDFYLCGNSDNPWLATGITGEGGEDNEDVGELDTTTMQPGKYVLRLEVHSRHHDSGKQQSFYDYLPVVVYDATSDLDGDGLTDREELTGSIQTNPARADTDGDGLQDGEEIRIYHTDPTKYDTDRDGLTDYYEIKISNTDPLNPDTDNDGYTDGHEVRSGSNPKDPLDLPVVITSTPPTSAEVDVTLTYQVTTNSAGNLYSLRFRPAGMQIDQSTGLITWKPDISVAGSYQFVFIDVFNGTKTATQFSIIYVNAINNGDINEDGVVNATDVSLAQQIVDGTLIPSERQKARADVVYDQVIDNADVAKIQTLITP